MEDLAESDIEKKQKKNISLIEKSQKGLHDWFVTKGWIYLMVFIMGILTGGLIWK